MQRQVLADGRGTMTFAPASPPMARAVVYAVSSGGNTDIYSRSIGGGTVAAADLRRPPSRPRPVFSPDGTQIVFESDRSGTPQLYVMPASGGEARRISFGAGRYGTPVWSRR